MVLPHIRQNRISVGNVVASEFGLVLGGVVFRSQIISDEEGWLDAVGKVGIVARLAVGLSNVPSWSSGFSLLNERDTWASCSLLWDGHCTAQRTPFTLR